MIQQLSVRRATTADIAIIHRLAHDIWPVAYKDILSPDQLAYMLDLIYSMRSLEKQMTHQEHVFMIADINGIPVGFASYSKVEEPGVYKLHKLYLSFGIQGKGCGKEFLNKVIETIIAENATMLRLNVNRFNKARTFYEKLGFEIIGEENIDIGNNYFMNDFVMQRKLV